MKNNEQPRAWIILILLIGGIIESAPLSLQQAQQMMFANNPELAAAAKEQEKNRFAMKESQALWYPSVDVAASYGYTTKVSELTQNVPGKTTSMMLKIDTLNMTVPATITTPATTNKFSMGDNDKLEFGADISYAFTQSMVNFYNVKYRAYAMKVKDAQINTQRNQLSFKLGMLYLAWEMGTRQLDVQDSLISQLSRYHELILNMKSGGLSSNARVLEAQARLEMARFDRVVTGNTRDSLKLEVLSLINASDTAINPQPYDFSSDITTLQSIPHLSSNPDRPELKSIDEGIIQLTTLNKITIGQKYPNLGIMAGWRYANPGLNLNDDKFMSYGLIGAQVKWNLFDGFRVSAVKQQTTWQIEVFKKNRENLVNTFERSCKQALLQVSRAAALESAASASLDAADALTMDMKNSLDAGMSTQVEYLNAVTQQSKAALGVEQARFAGKIARLQLDYARGLELKY